MKGKTWWMGSYDGEGILKLKSYFFTFCYRTCLFLQVYYEKCCLKGKEFNTYDLDFLNMERIIHCRQMLAIGNKGGAAPAGFSELCFQ